MYKRILVRRAGIKKESVDRDYTWLIRLSIISALLTVVNSTIASLALGVFQGLVVAFTTPFAFSLGRMMYPKRPAATIIYLPLVVVSFFTPNFGILVLPQAKIFFLLGSLLYDGICYVLRIQKDVTAVSQWKLIIANFFYPIGLLLAALIIIDIFNITVPILSKGWTGAILMLAYFGFVGMLGTIFSHKIYYKWLVD